PGLRASLSTDPDDHHGRAARRRADDAGNWGRLGASPAARLYHRRRLGFIAGPYPLYDTGRLYLPRSPARLDLPRKKEDGVQPGGAAACGMTGKSTPELPRKSRSGPFVLTIDEAAAAAFPSCI